MIDKDTILQFNPGFEVADLTLMEESPTFGKDVIDLIFFGNRELHVNDEEGYLWFLTTYDVDDTLVFVEGTLNTEDELQEAFRLLEEAEEPSDWHDLATVIDGN